MASDPPGSRPADPPAAGPPGRPRSAAWRVGLAVLVVGGLVGAASWAYFRPRPPTPAPQGGGAEGAFPPDPRLAYRGPFRNVSPDVRYVSDGECAACHREIARTYGRHPMGRSLAPIARADRPPDDRAHHNPFEAFDILFRVDRRGDRTYHRQSRRDASGGEIYDFAHEVSHAVGSGTRGHSYFTVRDGFVFQTPVSWFAQKQAWGLSPGFAPWAVPGRLVPGACLSCHANRVEPVEHTRNRYHEPVFRGHAVGCQRCHGPGERHVRTAGKEDVVNPGRLEPALREAVCQQCHLEGAARVVRRGRGLNDFRPGMPLEAFVTVFVKGPGKDAGGKAVNHVEQMYQSRCFRGSAGKKRMGCTTCHNPHEAVAPDRRVDHYRNRCLGCHRGHGCAVPERTRRGKSPQDSCIACHMPTSPNADVVHTAATDHRIVRRIGAGPGGGEPGTLPDVPLLDFHRGVTDLRDRGAGRDLGIGLYQEALHGLPLSGPDGGFAVGLLNRALEECPGDLPAWEAKGKILQTVRRHDEAVEAFEALLKRAPRHEGALVALGALERDRGRPDAALGYWRRAVEVNPWVAEYRKNLSVLLADRDAWAELRRHVQKWRELDPGSVPARQTWIRWLLREGRRGEAEAEFATIRALRPAGLEGLEAWFAGQKR